MKAAAVVIAFALAACTGNDTTHWYCYEPARAARQGGAPHKFNDSGSHRCTKAELDTERVAPEDRPADQR